jgi:hypothetical protein
LAGQEKDTGGGTGWQGWRREKETVFSSVHVEYKMPGSFQDSVWNGARTELLVREVNDQM